MLWYLEAFISISKMLRRCRWFVLPCRAAGSGMGRDGMGWDGKGCHGMGVGLGRGTPCGNKLENSRVFYQQITPRHHLGALLASAGQLVAPSGLLFEVLFVTLGRYWGPPGPKLQKETKIIEKWMPKGRLFT